MVWLLQIESVLFAEWTTNLWWPLFRCE